METAEIIVYFMIAVIIGGMVLGAFKGIEYFRLNRDLRSELKDDEKTFNVDKEQFPKELALRWEECGYGSANRTFSVYVKSVGTLNKSYVIDRLTMLNYCDDDEIDCLDKYHRFRIFNSTEIPGLISIECMNNTLIVAKIG